MRLSLRLDSPTGLLSGKHTDTPSAFFSGFCETEAVFAQLARSTILKYR
jgi:hypothetical protein